MLSIILLSYNSEKFLWDACSKVKSEMEKNRIPFEIIIIDDGSADNSYKVALELEKKHTFIKSYQLSKNSGAFNAIYAGLSVAGGDCATVIPDDGQLPAGVIVKMYREWGKGAKIIIPHRIVREDNFTQRFCANIFYVFINLVSKVKFPRGGADSFLIDREIIELVNTGFNPADTPIIAGLLNIGFDPVFIPYKRPAGINKKTRWTLLKRYQLFLDILYSSSLFPIWFIKITGNIFTIAGFFLFLMYLIKLPDQNDTAKSNFFIGALILISTGVILSALGILAEYIRRIYFNNNKYHGFIIKKKGSSV